MIIKIKSASNFKEWLRELEEYEYRKPEEDYVVEVSARLMCKILRLLETKEGV